AGQPDQPLLAIVERDAALDHADAAEHGGEKIVEVMSDTAGKLADRVHFLGLRELALQLLAVCDVEQAAGEAIHAVGAGDQHALLEEMLVATVGATPTIFDSLAALAQTVGGGGDHASTIFRMDAVD